MFNFYLSELAAVLESIYFVMDLGVRSFAFSPAFLVGRSPPEGDICGMHFRHLSNVFFRPGW